MDGKQSKTVQNTTVRSVLINFSGFLITQFTFQLVEITMLGTVIELKPLLYIVSMSTMTLFDRPDYIFFFWKCVRLLDENEHFDMH